MTQPSLFGGVPAIRVTQAVAAVERKRLSRQCDAILARLRDGDASNHTLSDIALKYTGRVSELRQAGYDIRVVARDFESGHTVYRLVSEP